MQTSIKHQTDVFSQVKTLVTIKGMEVNDAIQEIEGCLHTKLPENIKSLIKEESYRWGGRL